MNTFEKFKFDHVAVRKLFIQFRQALEAGDTHQMRRLQQTIFHELNVRRVTEEEVFYPQAQQVGGEIEDLVKKGKAEHHAVKS